MILSSGVSTVNKTAGTSNFKAPEQSELASAESVGVQADIYGFGGVAIDTLTGEICCFS